MLVFGSPPNSFTAEQKSLVLVASSAWTSNPTTISQVSRSTLMTVPPRVQLLPAPLRF